jgi:hypothetical protein
MVEQGKITGINGEEIILSCSSLSGGCKSCSGNSFCSTNGKIFSALNENNFDLKSGGLAVGFYITYYYNKISKRKNTPQITKRISNGQ